MRALPQNGRLTALPRKTGDIDWDSVAESYAESILSPFAVEMVSPDENGRIRNQLITDLAAIPQDRLARSTLADFGCGPGNLIPHLPEGIKEFVGVDWSRRALGLARKRAAAHQVPCTAHPADLRSLDLQRTFDLIISANAILPQTRREIVQILKGIRRHLKPTGRLLAILPSFDTTLYLQTLWHGHWLQETGSVEQAARMAKTFEKQRQMDRETCAFADDGENAQCYHTPETIDREFAQAGLKRIRPLRKIYYPWDLAKKFNYGYFPDAPEEIWDWYGVFEVEGKPSRSAR